MQLTKSKLKRSYFSFISGKEILAIHLLKLFKEFPQTVPNMLRFKTRMDATSWKQILVACSQIFFKNNKNKTTHLYACIQRQINIKNHWYISIENYLSIIKPGQNLHFKGTITKQFSTKKLSKWAFINFLFNTITTINCINQVFISNLMCSDIV